MAKYSRSAGKDVKRAMHRRKKGSLKRGKYGKGGTVKSGGFAPAEVGSGSFKFPLENGAREQLDESIG